MKATKEPQAPFEPAKVGQIIKALQHFVAAHYQLHDTLHKLWGPKEPSLKELTSRETVSLADVEQLAYETTLWDNIVGEIRRVVPDPNEQLVLVDAFNDAATQQWG